MTTFRHFCVLFTIPAMLTVAACTSVVGERTPTADRLTLTSVPVAGADLVEILNYGYVRELNERATTENETLRLRLHSVPEEGACVEDTHVVCSHRYWLAASSFDIGGGEAVFYLGHVGEISEVRWLEPPDEDAARVEVVVLNWANHGTHLRNDLELERARYQLTVRFSGVELRRLE